MTSQKDEVRAEPVAWGRLGTLNGSLFLRVNYDDPLVYPPSPSVIKNLNLVPLYTHPPAITDEMVEKAAHALARASWSASKWPDDFGQSTRERVYRTARAALEAAWGVKRVE